MKKQLAVLAVLLVAVQFSSAQQTSASEFQYGVQAGVNLANFTEGQDFINRVGLNAGLFATYKSTESALGLRSGIHYSQLGVKTSGRTSSIFSEDSRAFEAIAKLDYLQVPVLLDYNLSPAFSLFAGSQVSFLVNNSESYDYKAASGMQASSFEQELENVQTVSLSGVVGARAFLYKNAFIQAQYELGFYDIFEDNEFPQDGNRTFSYKDFRYSVFTFVLGYQF